MRIKSIYVELTKTIQEARFEPIKATVGMSAEVEPNESIAKVRTDITRLVSRELGSVLKARQQAIEELRNASFDPINEGW